MEKWISICLCLLFALLNWQAVHAATAEAIFAKHTQQVFQIQTIELASDNKSSIGSGFQISSQGHIATNYHVIADALLKPRRYKLQFLTESGETGPLEIINFDIIHDLAILKHAPLNTRHFKLRNNKIRKGTRTYAIGNPFDLGMTIIEGTYNGFLEHDYYRRMLFSGSLNPGMSGGPAIDSNGRVIGVNVATAGNQLSFLVPVRHLKKLLAQIQAEKASESTYSQTSNNAVNQVHAQLAIHQDEYISALLADDWETQTLGETTIPARLAKHFKCWGSSEEVDDEVYIHSTVQCNDDENIYISNSLQTGGIRYNFHWLSSEHLSSTRFYAKAENFFGSQYPHNSGDDGDLTTFHCDTAFVNHLDKSWKWALCVRQYKEYPNLFDLLLVFGSLNNNHKALVGTLTAAGLSQTSTNQLVKRFMDHLKWPSS